MATATESETTSSSYTSSYVTTGAAVKPSSTAQPASDSPLLFSTPDYVVFAISLAIPVAIGLFFFFYKRKQNTIETFLVGERSMNFIAVGLSLLASELSGVFVIGTPAEIHYYGMTIVYKVIGLFIATVVVAHIFIPKYQQMSFTSAYEYVEKRYNYATRVIASLEFCASVVIYLAVVLYVPSLVFSQVTTLNLYAAIGITGGLCTIYTAIGGMRAVVWTDAVQMIILLVGLIAVAALGSAKVKDGATVWQIALDTGRVNFDSFSADPRVRHTFWTQSIGQAAVIIGIYVANQLIVQRYIAVKKGWRGPATVYVAYIMFLPLAGLITYIGLVLHAQYYQCEPLLKKKISIGNQIMQYFIMDTLGPYHGIPGLLMASVFAAALSAVSAVINSLSAVCLNDFVFPAVAYFRQTGRTCCGGKCQPELTDRQKRYIAIGLVVFFGLLTIGLSCLASAFTSQLIQATSTIWGVIGGPVAGIFIMGFFMPFCNSAGAICGMLGGLIFTLWICIGSFIYSPTPTTLPLGMCIANRTISLPLPDPNAQKFALMNLYNVSYAWYGVIGIGSSIIIGVIVSLLTCGWRKSHMHSVDRETMYLCCCARLLETESPQYYKPSDSTVPYESNHIHTISNGAFDSQTTLSTMNDVQDEPPNF